jgi:GNAT superfamily N-acetyltransferase
VVQEFTEERVLSVGPPGVAFATFAGRFNWRDREEAILGLQDLRLQTQTPSLFRLDGDPPVLTEDFLFLEGWVIKYELVQMAWESGSIESSVELLSAETPADRIEVASFMTDQFMIQGRPEMRQLIISATSRSPLDLYRLRGHHGLLGAVMLSETDQCLGLYNLCVDQQLRGKGTGSKIVSWVQQKSLELGKPIVLQCSPELKGFYRSCGFRVSGSMQCWGRLDPSIM